MCPKILLLFKYGKNWLNLALKLMRAKTSETSPTPQKTSTSVPQIPGQGSCGIFIVNGRFVAFMFPPLFLIITGLFLRFILFYMPQTRPRQWATLEISQEACREQRIPECFFKTRPWISRIYATARITDHSPPPHSPLESRLLFSSGV